MLATAHLLLTAYAPAYLEAARKASFQNRPTVKRSESAGCFHCVRSFEADDVCAWHLDGDDRDRWTARCPHCAVDAVVGDAAGYPVTDRAFLLAMRSTFYGAR